MMRRLPKVLLVTTLVALILLVMAGIGLHGSRSSFDPPNLIKPDLAQVIGGHVYIYAARVDQSVVLFDTGQDDEGRAVDALLAFLSAKRQDVHDIFLTHGHSDHVAAAPLFPDARIWAGRDDVELAAQKTSPKSLLTRFFNVLMPAPPVTVTQALTLDEQVSLGQQRMLRAIPMPGHTPGSYAYLFDGVLFVGDTMGLKNGKLTASMAIFDADSEANRQAIVKLQNALSEVSIDRVCTSHGGCTAAGEGTKELQDFARSLGAENTAS